ncbi:MAG TPA: ATP-binding cassette domain-containing protein [Polyangiales bacterium]|nr:ATP-binding cassette domain-containing protein [Polyangiales bacterium]
MRVEGEGIRKRFGRIEALRGIDFAIPSGGKVGLIGPNASGKSTLIRIILGLLRCEGELLLDGKRRRGVEVAERIAYVPQIAPKFSASVDEVVRAITRVREISRSDVLSCGKEVGIDLRAVGGQSYSNLSGGAKQKTLIALALASRASFYVLDEPTASLDTQSRRDLFHLLSDKARDATLILCSHRLEEIRTLVEQVMVLEEGRLVYFGPTEDYLDQMTLSTIEVQTKNGADERALTEMGFHHGIGGWWTRTATRSEKLALVEQLSHGLEGRIANLLVRDAEAVQPETRGGKDDVDQGD